MNLTEQFLQFALLGANWVLWVLIGLSVASVAIVIERWMFFRQVEGRDLELVKSVHAALSDGAEEELDTLLKDKPSPGARILRGMLNASSRGATAISAIMTGTRALEKLRLERNLAFLGTVGSNAPFIGLFGTVLEILRVFNLLGKEGVTSGAAAADIMTGISEALVATAIGLLVAIPAVIAYNAFQRRVKRYLSQADSLTGMALSLLAESHPNRKAGD